MDINVSVDNVDLTSQVTGNVRRWNDETEEYEFETATLGDLVADKLAKAIRESDAYPSLKQRVTAIRDEQIQALIGPEIEAAVNAPIQRTNTYGEPSGKSVTLRELILDEVQKFMQRPVDSYGRDKGTVLQAWLRDAVEKVIKKELAEVLIEEKAKVVDAVRAKAADLIAQAVKEGIGR